MEKDTLHIINDDGGCCTECRLYKDITYLSNTAELCPECYIEKEVPEINFSERLDCAWLWSKENQCVDTANLATLVQCGWFMSEKVIDEAEKVPKAVYKLKYYGKKACPRCVGIQFSKLTPACTNNDCKGTVIRGIALQNDFADDT